MRRGGGMIKKSRTLDLFLEKLRRAIKKNRKLMRATEWKTLELFLKKLMGGDEKKNWIFLGEIGNHPMRALGRCETQCTYTM